MKFDLRYKGEVVQRFADILDAMAAMKRIGKGAEVWLADKKLAWGVGLFTMSRSLR